MKHTLNIAGDNDLGEFLRRPIVHEILDDNELEVFACRQ